MAEYGSGIFYGKANSRFLNSSQLLSSSISQVLCLPPALDIGPPIVPIKVVNYQAKENKSEKFKDVVILSEFSEIEGPIPLVAIPQHIPRDLDLNELVLQLMSTDYQNTGSSDFKISKDTSLLLQDYEKNHHIYVHYFTLYDVRARGFVRPMCLAYITREAQKLKKFYKEIKDEFSKVTEYLKISNLQIFEKEIQDRIEDLHYTKRRYICAHDHFPRDEEDQDSPRAKKLSSNKGSFYKHSKVKHSNVSVGTEENLEELSSTPLQNSTSIVCHSSSPSEPSTLAAQIQSEFTPVKASSLSPNESKENVLESSSDSSTSTIKVSSLMLDESIDQKMNQNEERSILQHTSLEALAAQLLDCQFIAEITNKYLSSSLVVRELQEFLEEVQNNSQSPVYEALEELGTLEDELRHTQHDPSQCSPSVFVIALMRRNFRNMRQIRKLCGIGYAASLIQLLSIFEQFSKSTLTLHFERLDREMFCDPMSSLFIGHIPVIHSGVTSRHKTSGNRVTRLSDSCWDKDVASLLSVDLSKISTPESEYVDANESFEALPGDVTVGDDCLELFVGNAKRRHHSCPTDEAPSLPRDRHPSTPVRSTSSDGTWSLPVTRLADSDEGVEEEAVSESPFETPNKVLRLDIDERMDKGNVYQMSALIQQFSGVSQSIINSILSGKPIIIAGPQYLKKVVILYTKALSTILPYKPFQPLPVLDWHRGTVTPHHINQFRIIGICIPERLHVQDLMSIATLNKVTVLNIETGHISGVAYSGSLLHKGDQLSRRRFRSNQTLQTALQAIIVSLGTKCFLLFHLLRTTNRTSAEILKGIGVPRGDWTIIQFLTQTLREQIGDCPFPL